jgi:hypothetical protein
MPRCGDARERKSARNAITGLSDNLCAVSKTWVTCLRNYLRFRLIKHKPPLIQINIVAGAYMWIPATVTSITLSDSHRLYTPLVAELK